jgi:hypothetical protein
MKTLTVDQFLEQHNLPETLSGGTLDYAMIEFAKLHVTEALKQASENATTYTKGVSDGYECWDVECVNEDSILYAYPLQNIK